MVLKVCQIEPTAFHRVSMADIWLHRFLCNLKNRFGTVNSKLMKRHASDNFRQSRKMFQLDYAPQIDTHPTSVILEAVCTTPKIVVFLSNRLV